MTIHIAPFDPHTASDELWAAFNATRRAIAVELWPDEPVLDDAETRREILTTNPMVEFRRWVAMEGACRDAHCRLPTSPVHTSRSLPGSVAPTIKVGADIKSP